MRTVIKTSGVWGYPAIYTQKRVARFSTDNERPLMSLLTMVGPSPDWCIGASINPSSSLYVVPDVTDHRDNVCLHSPGVDSVNLCSDDCSWVDRLDMDLYPWDAGTDSGTYCYLLPLTPINTAYYIAVPSVTECLLCHVMLFNTTIYILH